MSEEELKAFRNLNTFSTKYIVNKKASSDNDIATMFIYIAKLEVELEHKDKEIERLNNIINELDNMFYETFRISQNGYYSISEWELKEFTDKIKELKGSDKE